MKRHSRSLRLVFCFVRSHIYFSYLTFSQKKPFHSINLFLYLYNSALFSLSISDFLPFLSMYFVNHTPLYHCVFSAFISLSFYYLFPQLKQRGKNFRFCNPAYPWDGIWKSVACKNRIFEIEAFVEEKHNWAKTFDGFVMSNLLLLESH